MEVPLTFDNVDETLQQGGLLVVSQERVDGGGDIDRARLGTRFHVEPAHDLPIIMRQQRHDVVKGQVTCSVLGEDLA